MEIRLLGPVELLVDGASVPVAGTKLRAVLAMLALEANRPVSTDRLMEGLWGERLPASAAKMVQHYVWQLRRLLPADDGAEIVTRGRGYELHVDPERVDVLRLERLIGDAAQPPGNGAAREALALWRAAPLADVADPRRVALSRRTTTTSARGDSRFLERSSPDAVRVAPARC